MGSTGSSPSTGGQGIAFFDLDATLLGCNSAYSWLFTELSGGHLGPWMALRAVGALACYSIGVGDAEPMLRQSYLAQAGRDAEATARRIACWYQRKMRHRMRPGGLAAIRRHRAAGESCVLLTSATQHLSGLVERDLALDGVVCTTLEIDAGGRYTGQVVGRVCFGAGKAAAATDFAAAAGAELSACTFYTDSFSDLPVMEIVGTAVAVHPDPKLRRLAAARGWPVVDWSRAAV